MALSKAKGIEYKVSEMQDNFKKESTEFEDILQSELSKKLPAEKITGELHLQNMISLGDQYESELKDITVLNKALGVENPKNKFSVKSTID